MKKFKTRQEIALEIGICTKTLTYKLKQNNIELRKGLISPIDQEIVYKLFGIRSETETKTDF